MSKRSGDSVIIRMKPEGKADAVSFNQGGTAGKRIVRSSLLVLKSTGSDELFCAISKGSQTTIVGDIGYLDTELFQNLFPDCPSRLECTAVAKAN